MRNSSKANPHKRIKWYQSGAIAQKEYPKGSLVIVGIVEDHNTGLSTLSLGDFDGDPICAIVVPTSRKHEIGMILDHIPGNAVPVEEFFWYLGEEKELGDDGDVEEEEGEW